MIAIWAVIIAIVVTVLLHRGFGIIGSLAVLRRVIVIVVVEKLRCRGSRGIEDGLCGLWRQAGAKRTFG